MLANAVLIVKINVFSAFECDRDRGCPVTSRFIVAVLYDMLRCVGETKANGTILDTEEVVDAFVGGINFSDAGAVGGPFKKIYQY